jgi:apolipoprotein N-acyltransferase
LLGLTAVALLLGMGLVISGAYFAPGTRHGIWVLPFIIPPLGWLIADACTRIAGAKSLALPLMTVALLVLGYISYNPVLRFTDGTEYDMRESQWQALLYPQPL